MTWQQGRCPLQYWPVKAEYQAATCQPGITKQWLKSRIQHPLCHFPSPPESPGCSGNLQYWNRWLDRLTHWRYSGGKYLRRLKWAMCQHSTSIQATDWGRETLLVSCLVDWMIDRWGKPQSAFSLPKYRGSRRGDCCCHLSPVLPLYSGPPPQTSEERGHRQHLSLKLNDHIIVPRGHIQTWNTMFWRMIDCVLNLAVFNYWAETLGTILLST